MKKSHWQDFEMPRFPRLSEKKVPRTFDVVVIGGGVTGVSTAYLLKLAGAKVCLLERGRLACGNTGHTTAHLNAFVDIRVADLVRNFGEQNAALTLQAGKMAIDTIEALVHREGIACEFRRTPGYLHAPLVGRSAGELERVRLRKDAEHAQDLGFECAYVAQVPGISKPGVRFEGQALFHPLKFLAGLARAIPGNGSEIHEGSEVVAVEDGPLRVVGQDFEIGCGQVAVATHVPLVGKNNFLSATLFQTKLALYSTYALGARIPRGVLPDASASDTSDPYYYWRVDPGERSDYLVLGGRDHKTGQAHYPEQRFTQLEIALARLAPDAKVDRRWSGQIVETHDGLPFIGEIRAGQFVATGFTGNGMTFGVVAGLMARDHFVGQPNPWIKLFSPRRLEVRGSAIKDYFVENVDFPVYLLKQRLSPPEKRKPESLRRGEGAVLKIDGERVACSRGDDGELHQVSAVCTHLGCLVEWNGAERTWDCPCHGSRFEPSGAVVAGPAERPLKPFGEDIAPEPVPVRRKTSVRTREPAPGPVG